MLPLGYLSTTGTVPMRTQRAAAYETLVAFEQAVQMGLW